MWVFRSEEKEERKLTFAEQELGNPLGGLVYSSGLPSSTDNTTLQQVISWNNFIGSGVSRHHRRSPATADADPLSILQVFCFKICDPSVTLPNYCQNIYDLIGW